MRNLGTKRLNPLKLEKAYNPGLKFSICPEFRGKRNNFSKCMRFIEFKPIDDFDLDSGNKGTNLEAIHAIESLKQISCDEKIDFLENRKNTEPFKKKPLIFHNLCNNSYKKSYRTEFQVSPSYFRYKYPFSLPNSFLSDIQSKDKNIINNYYKNKTDCELLPIFADKVSNDDLIAFYDARISISEKIFKELIFNDFDSFHASNELFVMFSYIYPEIGSLFLKLCIIFPEISLDWLKEKMKQNVINTHIKKNITFSPYLFNSDASSYGVSSSVYQAVLFSRNDINVNVTVPINFPVENLSYISKVVALLLDKLLYMSHPLPPATARKIDLIVREVMRTLRSYNEIKFKCDLKRANVYVSAALLCNSLIGIRGIDIKDINTNMQSSIGIIDEALSGPEKVISILIDETIKKSVNSVINISDFFKAADLEQVLNIHVYIRLLINSIFILLGDEMPTETPYFVKYSNGTLLVTLDEEAEEGTFCLGDILRHHLIL